MKMNSYFRITAYHKEHNISAIFDSFGRYEKLRQFSAELVKKGFKIIKVNRADSFLVGNVDLLTEENNKIRLRAASEGEPLIEPDTYQEKPCEMVIVGDKAYIPDFQN